MNSVNVLNVKQGEKEWLEAKLGVISASNIAKVLAKKGTETRAGYMSELIGQIATREAEELNAKALTWGKENEVAARAVYQFDKSVNVETIGFIYGADKRIGCSPDGMITSLNKGIEIKCPLTPKVHVDFLTMDKVKIEYVYQVQFSMFVTGFDQWDFCSYHPRFKVPGTMFKAITIDRDQALMERFANDVGEFVSDMDKELLKLGINFGDQWSDK